jgi:hypothetical protein
VRSEELAAALRRGTVTRQDRARLLAVLLDAPVYAAVSATATGEELSAAGLRHESGAELAVLLLEAPDGSRALPVFSDLDELRRWRLDARPVPLTGSQACAAARDEGATQLVLDPAGQALVLDAAEVTALADGSVPVTGTTLTARTTEAGPTRAASGVDTTFEAALRRALEGEPLRAARLLAGAQGLVLGVAPARPLSAAGLAALAQRVLGRLGDALPAEGLDLMQVPARGPGLDLLRRRRWSLGRRPW